MRFIESAILLESQENPTLQELATRSVANFSCIALCTDGKLYKTLLMEETTHIAYLSQLFYVLY